MNKSACFIGHRKVNPSPDFQKKLKNIIVKLIEKEKIENFLFGGKSEFNDICYDIVSDLMKQYPQIKRIHYRTNYPNADEYTKKYLLQGYEESIFPQSVFGAGRASYIKRNQEMIINSDICVFYYNKTIFLGDRKHLNTQHHSGTALAYNYAVKTHKKIINTA